MKVVILGLSITSSWGNGHATTYRGLSRALAAVGHEVIFLERDVPWYAGNRDCHKCKFCKIGLYRNLQQLETQYGEIVRHADLVLVGSYVPDGIWIGEWVTGVARGITAFYDIDTPITLARLQNKQCDYLSVELIPKYQIYLSFTGGPTLGRLEGEYGSPMARPLYCSVDLDLYSPISCEKRWILGYLGTYSDDRQPALRELLLKPAVQTPEHSFAVAGAQYPEDIRWPDNVSRITHLEPKLHRKFYNEQSFTLNITRADMKRAGYSPSVRLFEAAACGTPIITDYWSGIENFFIPGEEILIAQNHEDILGFLREISPKTRKRLGEQCRRRILSSHTSAHRVRELEGYLREVRPVGKKLFPPNSASCDPSVVISRTTFYENI